MKQLFYLGFGCLLLCFTIGCNDANNSSVKEISDYYSVGEFHNRGLSAFENDWNGSYVASSKEDAIDYIKSFVVNHDLFLPEEIEKYQPGFDVFGNIGFLDTESMYRDFYENDKLNEVLNVYFNSGYIDEFEKQLLKDLTGLLELGAINTLAELETGLNELMNDWNGRNYSKDSHIGDLSAISLVIAKYSLEYWTNYYENHPEEIPEAAKSEDQIDVRAAPIVVAIVGAVGADVVGAATGIVGAGIWDTIVDDGVLEGWEGPGAAINGAFWASTGFAGAVGSWIKSWF